MSRADLLALTPEAIATLTNLGLVKRAVRENQAGQGPELEESEDGVVTGRFPDGTQVRLIPGRAFRDCPCTCAATSVCRHRVAVALAYPTWHAARGPGTPEPQSSWSPAGVSDETLRERLGKRGYEAARALVAQGLDAEVRRRDPQGRPADAVRLPTCSVQFLVPGDLAYVRCDCVLVRDCEHVALAVWAFRAALLKDPGAASLLVHLGPAAAAPVAGPEDAISALSALAEQILLAGVVGSSAAMAAGVARARLAAERLGMTWLATLVDDLEQSLDAYRQRSARYTPRAMAALLAEVAARTRAARGSGELPARFVLGIGEARDTQLDQVRLVSLGARLQAEEQERQADVFLADPLGGVVLVLRKQWSYPAGTTPEEGPALAERVMAPAVKLRELAHGQVVTRSAHRLANRSLLLPNRRRGSLSVTPQIDAWDVLGEPLMIRDLAAHAAALRHRPPQLLRPRVLAESVHVIAVDQVLEVVYDPGEQALLALLVDPAGNRLRLVKRHRSVAPHAIESLAAALIDRDHPVRFVSGELRSRADGLELDPLAVVTDRTTVPDLAQPAAPVPLPLAASVGGAATPEAVRAAAACLEQAVHQGLLRSAPEWRTRLTAAARQAEAVGLRELGTRLLALDEVVGGAQGSLDQGLVGRVAPAWDRAALWVALLEERAAFPEPALRYATNS